MKNLIIKILLIIPATFLFNGRELINCIAERTMGESDVSIPLLLNVELFGFVNLSEADLSYMLFSLTFAVCYIFMFGHTLSDNLNVSGIYIFTRANKRTKWMLKNTAVMLAEGAAVTAANVLTAYDFAIKIYGSEGLTEVSYLIKIFILTTLYIWLLLIISNFMSALFGSTIGISIGAGVHYVLIILSRYTYNAPILKYINPLVCVFNTAEKRLNFLSAILILTAMLVLITAAFCVYVKKSDISLTNKEMII